MNLFASSSLVAYYAKQSLSEAKRLASLNFITSFVSPQKSRFDVMNKALNK